MSIDNTRKLLDRLRKKTQLMVGRCVLSAAEEKGLLTSQVEALEGETLEGVERLENYGLAGHPPAGSEGALFNVGGSRDHPLLVGLEHRKYRPELASGEVQLYSMFKQMIHLDKDGNIRIKAPKGVIIEAESFEATLTKDVKFQSETFWSNSEQDTAFTAQRFGVAAEEGAEIDGSSHFTKELETDRHIKAKQDITSEQQVRDQRSSMQEMRNVYNPHTHPNTGPANQKM